MMCYRDRWWCSFWEDCKDNEGCDRVLRGEELERAKRWSKEVTGQDMLLVQGTNKPKCHKESK